MVYVKNHSNAASIDYHKFLTILKWKTDVLERLLYNIEKDDSGKR